LTVAVCSVKVSSRAAAVEIELPNPSFETGDLSSWAFSGDVAVLDLGECLQPQLPSDGVYAACLSTEDLDENGTAAVGGVRSELVSPPISLDFRPDSLKVSFEFDYGSDETLQSVLFNDSVTVTLLTPIGPYPILVSDTWGTTLPNRGLKLNGSTALGPPNPGCPVARQTDRIFVDYKRGIPASLAEQVANGPIQVQFSVSDQGGLDGLTFLCIDNLRIRAKKR
jgi:hypothetical protein